MDSPGRVRISPENQYPEVGGPRPRFEGMPRSAHNRHTCSVGHSPAGTVHSIEEMVAHAAHRLPAQGPIGVFIHHNTLHAFQHLPFEEAVRTAAEVFDAQPYMTEEAYRRDFERERILMEDVERVLQAEGRDIDLRRRMLVPGLSSRPAETILWEIEENGLLDDPARRARFDFWLPFATGAGSRREVRRPAEGILRATGENIDDTVNPLLIKLCGAFLDQGLAYWPMPNRHQGFWRAVLTLLEQRGVVETRLATLGTWVGRWKQKTALQAVESALAALEVENAEAFIEAELLSLPGWAGLMHQLEADPALAPHEAVPASLMDFLAVRMLLTAAAVEASLNRLADWKRGGESGRGGAATKAASLAAKWAEASELMGHSAATLASWPHEEVIRFRDAVEAFDDVERRRVWHVAYEWRHAQQILLPLQQYASAERESTPERLAAQVFFCIDEREESIRRHLEEIDPEIETFGAAGFFGVAMNYKGLDDAHGVPLCPVVVKPQHAIRERPAAGAEGDHDRRQSLRRLWSRIAREGFVSSRTMVRGWIGTTALGLLSLFPLAARVLSPRAYSRFMGWLNASVLPEPRTELAFMRDDAAGHDNAHGLMAGFTVEEKADRVASVLGPAGLRKGMARLVVVLGHGSTSLNNPHESAHDCGACGGRRGGPNARIFAAMANHPGVREKLRERGIRIPEDTWFIGGYHDTSNDAIDLYDLDALPSSHLHDLDRVRPSLDRARAASAHERTRRFEAASSSRQFIDGLHHVEARAEHLAEPRPEYGHCTNSVCFVGRRDLTRGLFLDRRAFLVSYDATQDPDNLHLSRVLGAVIPVCGGISLEYYFSFVDNERYGCGTKLPHNVTGLVGVMNGYESDLRTGLPWQMVEIHEPVRILFVVESTPDRVFSTIRANPLLWEFLDNRWIRLATVDPVDPARIHYYSGNGQWERVNGLSEQLQAASSSLAWYHGHREHLPVARIIRFREEMEHEESRTAA